MEHIKLITEETQQARIDFIRENCKPFLDKLRTRYENIGRSFRLFRGVHDFPRVPGDSNADYYPGFEYDGASALLIGHINENRKPRASGNAIHEFLDNVAFHATGLRLRSQGVFTSQCQQTAGIYGTVHVMLPIGDFQTHWMEFVRDAFVVFDAGVTSIEAQPGLFNDYLAKFLAWCYSQKVSNEANRHLYTLMRGTVADDGEGHTGVFLRGMRDCISGADHIQVYKEVSTLFSNFLIQSKIFKNDPFSEKQVYNEEIIITGAKKHVLLKPDEYLRIERDLLKN